MASQTGRSRNQIRFCPKGILIRIYDLSGRLPAWLLTNVYTVKAKQSYRVSSASKIQIEKKICEINLRESAPRANK